MSPSDTFPNEASALVSCSIDAREEQPQGVLIPRRSVQTGSSELLIDAEFVGPIRVGILSQHNP